MLGQVGDVAEFAQILASHAVNRDKFARLHGGDSDFAGGQGDNRGGRVHGNGECKPPVVRVNLHGIRAAIRYVHAARGVHVHIVAIDNCCSAGGVGGNLTEEGVISSVNADGRVCCRKKVVVAGG